jgi:AcrR family transcriptional regulator
MGARISDRRIRRSIKLIKNSFFALSKQKPLEKITVMDICSHADINRCTFYAHYENMEAFFKDLETELSETFLHAFSLYSFDKNSRAAVDALFDCIRKNPALISLAGQIGKIGKGNKIIENAIRECTFSEWLSNSQISSEQALLLEAFMISGGRQIIEMWVESDFAMDENMVKDVFENAIKHGIYHFIYAS